jgi:hypothetical protein
VLTWSGGSQTHMTTPWSTKPQVSIKICQVFFPDHPQGKKPGGCMIHVYIYIEERDMIHDYICMLDLCLYIVARDNHENWDHTCLILSVLRLLTERDRQHYHSTCMRDIILYPKSTDICL